MLWCVRSPVAGVQFLPSPSYCRRGFGTPAEQCNNPLPLSFVIPHRLSQHGQARVLERRPIKHSQADCDSCRGPPPTRRSPLPDHQRSSQRQSLDGCLELPMHGFRDAFIDLPRRESSVEGLNLFVMVMRLRLRVSSRRAAESRRASLSFSHEILDRQLDCPSILTSMVRRWSRKRSLV